MNPAEQPLYQALEASPSDWSIRRLLIDKLIERGGYDEAGELIAHAPNAPATEEQLQRIVEVGGIHAIKPAKLFVQAHPESAFAHHALGELFAYAGEDELSQKHLSVASALGADIAPEEAATEEPDAHYPAEGGVRERTPPSATVSSVYRRGPATHAIVHADAIPAPLLGNTPGNKRGPKATAALIAVIVHAIILFIAALLVILPPAKDDPEIIASVIGPPAKKNEMQKKNVVKQTKQSSSASSASAPIARMMRASAMAKFAMPEVTRTSTGPLGMGEGDLGAGGFGGGAGLGSGASFFGSKSTGTRFAFILDYSGSMSKPQMDMVVREMEKTLKALKTGTQYQVVLFAGGGRFAEPGWGARNEKNKNAIIVDPKGKEYEFVSKGGYANYDFTGADASLPTSSWLKTTPENVRMTTKILNEKKLWGGTDWRWPFKMVLNLDPAPDVIFFMSDGTGGAEPPTILSYAKRKNPTVQINAFAMETLAGAGEMNELAERTKGQYRIILRNGKTVEGEEVFKDRKKVEALIKSGGK